MIAKKQTDLDGRLKYLIVVPICNTQSDNGLMVKVYPNPFTQTLMVDIKSSVSASNSDRIELYNNIEILVYYRSLGNRQGNALLLLLIYHYYPQAYITW